MQVDLLVIGEKKMHEDNEKLYLQMIWAHQEYRRL